MSNLILNSPVAVASAPSRAVAPKSRDKENGGQRGAAGLAESVLANGLAGVSGAIFIGRDVDRFSRSTGARKVGAAVQSSADFAMMAGSAMGLVGSAIAPPLRLIGVATVMLGWAAKVMGDMVVGASK